jgi:hypothetical protein
VLDVDIDDDVGSELGMEIGDTLLLVSIAEEEAVNVELISDSTAGAVFRIDNLLWSFSFPIPSSCFCCKLLVDDNMTAADCLSLLTVANGD